jgi:serine/threonine protein kinase
MAEAKEREAGEVLDGRYQLVERLGRGGFGDVWRADELLPDGTTLRQVALKLLHPGMADAQDWGAEARIIASLRHPALVTIYAAGLLEVDRPIPFVAMELLIGKNLAELAAQQDKVPWRRVLSWAREAAGALDVIHRASVVHLDLKPANLFLPDEGGIKVLDFGIARQGRGRPTTMAPTEEADEMSTAAFMVAQAEEGARAKPQLTGTMTRSVVGTPGFMPPEIFEDGEATAASDAYALAACIAQLATGRLPQRITVRPDEEAKTTLQAWFAEVQSATVRGQLRDLAADHPDLPPALIGLLQRWLALDPDARGVSRGTLHEQLDEVWRCPQGWDGSPYCGLASFGLHDEGKLFGRGPDTGRIGRELVDQPCLVLQGEGGIGLRSFALAGVVPELARAFADGRHDWLCCVVDLDEAPDEALRRSLGPWLDDHGGDGEVDDLLTALLAWADAGRVGVVLVLDDLHRLLEAPEEARRQVDRLARRLAEGHEGLRFIGTLREEHTPGLLELELGDALRPWLRFMTAPQPSAVRRIVAGPLGAKGITVEGLQQVVDELQAELQADGRRLPYLSLALDAWWRSADGAPQIASWRKSGGLTGWLVQHADEVFEAMEPTLLPLADGLLLRLVSVQGELLEVAEHELVAAADDQDGVRKAIECLVGGRLVVRSGPRLRLGHPGLVDGWARLNGLRLQDMDRLTFLEDLRDATQRWAMAGHTRAKLWGARRLGELDGRAAELIGDLGDAERAFIAATRKAVRLSWVIRGLVALCAVALLMGAYWFERTMDARQEAQRRRLEQAQTRTAIGQLVTRSRRTGDPYLRVALLAGAVNLGSTDPVLPLELLSTAQGLPRARFLSLQKVPQPAFPWGERWLLGGSGAHATLFDFKPPPGDEWGPVAARFRPHAQGMYDFVPLPFDTSFVTRGLDGKLKVWRLGDEGQLALAAVSPMRCFRGLSAILVAERAPVIACTTSDGLALWDLREVDKVRLDPFHGRVMHLSADGGWVAAARLRKVLLWHPQSGRRHEFDAIEAPSLARFSPRDELVALVRPEVIDVFDLRGDRPDLIHSTDTFISDPVLGQWGPSGVDFAACNYEGDGEWRYLRKGLRSPKDERPDDTRRPCRRRHSSWPRPLDHVEDYGQLLQRRSLGPRVYEGGWQLQDGRLITRDLVMFDPRDKVLAGLIGARGVPKAVVGPGESVAAVYRDGDEVVWQVGANVRIHKIGGQEVIRRPGHLLARCPDGRLLSWRRTDEQHWELFGARSDIKLTTVRRKPGFVIGTDPGCHKVVFQSLEGKLGSVDLNAARGDVVTPAALPGPAGSYVMDGYVYDARPSLGWAGDGGAPEPGLWLAFSGGAMVRVEGPSGSIRPYGHATPRSSAMTDGPQPGQLIFADETGLVLRSEQGQDRVLLAPTADRVWEDIRVLPGGHTLLVAWAHGVAMVDIARREILGELETRGRGRLAPWDDEGSTLVWAFDFMGQPVGEVIPIGPSLAKEAGAAASNLRAKLGPGRRPLIELED